jgi:hypothetical protein
VDNIRKYLYNLQEGKDVLKKKTVIKGKLEIWTTIRLRTPLYPKTQLRKWKRTKQNRKYTCNKYK